MSVLGLLPRVETSVTSVFPHVNKSDNHTEIYEVPACSSGTNRTSVLLADSAGLEARMVQCGGDRFWFRNRAYVDMLQYVSRL